MLPHHHIFCPFERIKCCSAPWVRNNSKDGAGCVGCLCPLCGPSIPKISQFQLFQLLKLYQHQQRNKARSLLLAQTPWTGYSVCAQLPAGTFVPDRGLFDSLFSSSIWIGCGWGWDVCCWTRGTECLSRGLRLFSAHWYSWGGEDGLVRMGGKFLSPWGLTQHLGIQGMCSARGISAPRGQEGKMLPWEKGDSVPCGLRKLSGSQKCAGFVPNPATSCWNTLLETGPGWAGSDWLTQPPPAQSLHPTAFHGLECLPEWVPAKTGNYLTWGARELLSWYLQIKGEELKTVVRVQPNLITSRDFISSKKFWIANLCS